jgi:hypothetical protein
VAELATHDDVEPHSMASFRSRRTWTRDQVVSAGGRAKIG